MKRFLGFMLLAFMATAICAQIQTPVTWKISLNDTGLAEKELVFTAEIDKGWHVYDMNLPEGGPVSTSFNFETLTGAELIGKTVATTKPDVVFDESFNMQLRWFSESVTFIQKFKVTDFKKFKIEGEVEYMACNDESCLPPERETFSFDNKQLKSDAITAPVPEDDKPNVAPDATAVAPDSQVVVPEDMFDKAPEKQTQTTSSASASEVTDQLTDQVDLWKPVVDQLKAYGDSTVSAADTSWFIIFITGFIGGLIALLTPCVWPMIPMTVSFFLKRTKNRKKAIRDALMYGASIIIIYLIMGLLITAIFGASALNDLSTNAIFNIIFFLLLVVFAISFFGAFELVLPASWTNKMDAKADTTTGLLSIFFMSFTLVLVSFSCTGPIIGTLLVQAASMGSAVGPAIGMFGFALALSIPFSLFAIFPSWLQSMPKSGGWLNSVKVEIGRAHV